MSPVEWAVRPLTRYAKFSGRAPRAEYWWFYLLTIVLSFLTGIIDSLLGLSESFGDGVTSGVLSVALLVPSLAVTVRRLHDTNRSGWWLLTPIVVGMVVVGYFAIQASQQGFSSTGPGLIAGAVLLGLSVLTLFVFMLLRGTAGPNDYGSDPYGPESLHEVFA